VPRRQQPTTIDIDIDIAFTSLLLLARTNKHTNSHTPTLTWRGGRLPRNYGVHRVGNSFYHTHGR